MRIKLCKRLDEIRDELSEETLIQIQDIKYEDHLVCKEYFVPNRCPHVKVYCPSYQEGMERCFSGISDVPDLSDIVMIDIEDLLIITIKLSTKYIVDLLERIIRLGSNFLIGNEVENFFHHTPQIIYQSLERTLPHFVKSTYKFNQGIKRNIFLFNDRPHVYTYEYHNLFLLSNKEILESSGFWIMSKVIFDGFKYGLFRLIDVILPPSVVDRVNFGESWKCIRSRKFDWSEKTQFIYQYNKEVSFNMDSLDYTIRRVVIETLLDIPIIYPDFLDTSLKILRNVK